MICWKQISYHSPCLTPAVTSSCTWNNVNEFFNVIDRIWPLFTFSSFVSSFLPAVNSSNSSLTQSHHPHPSLCQERPFPWSFFHTRCDHHLPREPFPDHPIWNSPSVFFMASIVLCQRRDLLSVSSTWSWAARGLCPGLLCSRPLTLHLAHGKHLGWSQTPASSRSGCPPGRGWVTIVLAPSFQSPRRLLHRTEHVFTKDTHTGIKK